MRGRQAEAGAGGAELARWRLRDARELRIALVSHCLLNQNARYCGGASCAGMRKEVLRPYADAGFGIVQMACPEMRAWGGPWKPLMWLNYGRGPAAQVLAALAFPFFLAWTNSVYRAQARRAAREAAAWKRAGWSVDAVVGIDGSPSCGVGLVLDMRRCLRLNGDPAASALDRDAYNRRLYAECAERGRGIFMSALEKALSKRGLHPSFQAHDLPSELGCRATSDQG